MKYKPCVHTPYACDSCALKQAEERIAQLEGLLCQVHSDCREHPLLAATCSKESPPRVGDWVLWYEKRGAKPIVAEAAAVDSEGRVWAIWSEGYGYVQVSQLTPDVVVLRRIKQEEP